MVDAETIIKGLQGNSDGMCRCPAHNDRKASLHVSTGANGKPLLHCHAGCAQERVIAALKSKGLWGRVRTNGQSAPRAEKDEDDMSAAQRDAMRFHKAFKILRAASQTKRGTLVVDYFAKRGITTVPTNAMMLNGDDARKLTNIPHPAVVFPIVKDDLLVGAHLTFVGKDGSNLRDDDGGGVRLCYGPMGGGHVEFFPNVADADAIIVGEGIETTLSAMQVTKLPGVSAINAANMRKIIPSAQRETIILADNDANETGENAAYDLKDALVERGRNVRIAMPRARGSDWNDVLQSDIDHADMARAILHDSTVFKGTEKIRPLTMGEFQKLQFPQNRLLLKPWLESSALAMIHARRGEAKTYLALAVAYAIATGRPLMDWTVPNPARVLYVDGELPGGLMQKRLHALGPESPNLTILSRDMFVMKRKHMFDLSDEKGRARLDRFITECDVEIIILDSLSTLIRSGIENEAEAWQPIQDWLMTHRWNGRTIVLICHEGVQTGRPRGTTKREDTLDVMIGLRKRPPDGEEVQGESSYEMHFTKVRSIGGADAAPRVIRLTLADGLANWSMERTNSLRERVKDMMAEGITQAQMAKRANVSKGRISQIVKELTMERAGKDQDGFNV